MTAAAEAHPFRAGDGVTLRYRQWLAPSTRAAIVVVHGLGEHSARYAELAACLTPLGISVVAPDLRGHGVSEGRRGSVRSFEDLLSDLDRAVELTGERFPSVPRFMLGHSFGGLLALRYAETRPDVALGGLVLSAPLLRLASPPAAWLSALARLLSWLAPSLPLPNGMDPAGLSRDPAEVAAYSADPLVHDRISPRLYTEMTAAMAAARAEIGRVRVKDVLVLVPGADPVVDPTTTLEAAADLARVTSVDVRGYSGFYHEVLHEVDRRRPMADIARWLDRRIA